MFFIGVVSINHKLLIGIVAALVIVALGVFFIQTPTALFGAGLSNKETVIVGVVLPLTGTSADNGNNAKNGLLLAQKEINSSNLKYKINLVFEDSEYNSEKAVSAINKLISVDAVKFVVGEYGSSQTKAIAPIAESNKVILITPGSQATSLSSAGDYIFRTQTKTDDESAYFAKKIFELIGNKKLGLIFINTEYGVSYIKDFSGQYLSLGGKLGLAQNYDSKESDFSTVLLKAKEDGVEYLLIGATRKGAAQILNKSKELGLKIKFFGASVIEGKEFLDIAGANAEGIIIPSPFNADSKDSAMVKFQSKFFAEHNSNGDMISANGYDALMLLSKCFESVGAQTDKVRDCLYSTKEYHGASGVISFDANGDVKKPFMLKIAKNGTFVLYEAS